ncbi:glycine zipper 2TM domain-containing protein [Nitratiruptor sp. YY09-18]|uniref:glycine zipper 2TM domain-containing protein n=1 Tax=Nitratiruptor sp. YY09-18 TaxID=2724901 RepID=UPI001915AFBC|nr:glycine zipper 2TM domain-containing protein [Nitratiruptor sp. YY09-18]BCD68199.1 outer membrane lipoprotein SlyB [Nitratiruptor sp. YY09-18]
MKKLFATLLPILFILAGCAQTGTPEYSPEATHQLLHYKEGKIVSIRPVAIKDNGTGAFLGAITGAVLGSLVGEGKGNTLATLAGGLSGMYVGSQVAKANAQELFIRLNNGRRVVVVVKGKQFYPGQRVRIIMNNGRIESVEPL